jgi:hypothetical protein
MTPLQPPMSPVIPTSYSNVTFRNIVHISTGGTQVRLTLSNEFGPGPLDIGGVHVALSGGGGAIAAASDRTITFGEREGVTIPPGGDKWRCSRPSALRGALLWPTPADAGDPLSCIPPVAMQKVSQGANLTENADSPGKAQIVQAAYFL